MKKKHKMKYLKNGLVGLGALAMFAIVGTSCQKDNKTPGIEYMPDMYRSEYIDTYEESDLFADKVSALKPVDGSIPRGFVPYEYPNSEPGYDSAKATLTNPYAVAMADHQEEWLEEGEELYDIFCDHCHGAKGMGQWSLVQNEKILGVPSYDDAGRAITEGSVYHEITYGRNIMGAHASQITPEYRWKITSYVMKLKSDLESAN